MADFQALRDELRRVREQLSRAEEELSQLRRDAAANEVVLHRLRRRLDENLSADKALLDKLTQKATDLKAAQEAKQADIAEMRSKIEQLLHEFALFSDPRMGVERLKDHVPCLLFPLRIETRFKKVPHNGAQVDELWVRIYPDDCLIDTFDAMLSETELRNARRYWQERWRAGGEDAGDRAAWRGLVSSHGSGRAEWIDQSYQPTNLVQKPKKTAAHDLILVVSTETPLAAAEEAAMQQLWRALWLADRDLVQEQVALDQLNQAVGSDRAQVILNEYRPFNLADAPPTGFSRAQTNLIVAPLVFPPEVPSKQQSWSRAPRVNLLPNRFVLLAYQGGMEILNVLSSPVQTPLMVGPDPSAPAQEQLKPGANGGLDVPEDMKWMVDFRQALAVGMGFRISLTPAQAAQGFDRLLVLGVCLEADENDGKKHLETLFQHHHFRRTGLAIIPQGTPTNNLEGQGTGFSSVDDPDESFDRLFKKSSGLGSSPDPLKKSDGFWLAEWLGIDPKVIATIANNRGSDQSESRAMSHVLWPATGDYFLRTMLHPMFSDDTLDQLQWFFTHFVSGRGMIPAIRIGRQPYGILPTTDFANIGWLSTAPIAAQRLTFLKQLHPVLQGLDKVWAKLNAGVSHVGDAASDPHQTLLNILGLHPSSAEYHFRFATNLTHLFNLNQFDGLGAKFLNWPPLKQYLDGLKDALHQLGATTVDDPDVLRQFFTERQGKFFGSLAGTPEHSETDSIDPLKQGSGNYLRWLQDAAFGSLDALRLEKGFPDEQPPRALLYLLLRHAILLGYHHTAYLLFQQAQQTNPSLISDAELAELKREPHFVHLSPSPPPNVQRSESRWTPLYTRAQAITGPANRLIGEYITDILRNNNPSVPAQREIIAPLRSQVHALSFLENAPTARLERVLVEHLDCCSYRFDAWQLGFAHVQLAQMRYQQVEDNYTLVQGGIYLGAYACVENLRSENKILTPVELSPELATVYVNEAPVVRDNTNGGYIHAPSLNHAVTAAVLRNGYLSRATPANHETMQVNISSNRVRLALQFMEGIRQGQSLGALLGYQLERGLHDRTTLPNLDVLIYDLRKQFPLRANQLPPTRDLTASIEQLEANNVIDGLKLLELIREKKQPKYPFGLPVTSSPVLIPDHLPILTAEQETAVNIEVDRLLDILDALSDLAIAESVHQATQGNFERAAATMDTFAQGKHPPEPSVVRTPTSGITLTHRVGLHFKPGLLAPTTNATPRSVAAPGLNDWLTGVLPPLSQISCTVTWKEPVTGVDHEPVVVTLEELKLQPLDVLQIAQLDLQQGMAELDDRVLAHVVSLQNIRPDTKLTIQYLQPGATHFHLAEVAPLIRTLKTLVQQSRPLRADDIALPNEATLNMAAQEAVNSIRITTVHARLPPLQGDITTLQAMLQTLLEKPVDNRDTILNGIDDFITQTVMVLQKAAEFGIPQAGWGFSLQWKQDRFTELITQTGKLVDRWTDRLAQFNTFIAQYNALPANADDQRFALLLKAEREVSTSVTSRPETPALLEPIVVGKGTAFAQKRSAFDAVVKTTTTSLATLYAMIRPLLPTTGEDPENFDLAKYDKDILLFIEEILGVLQVALTELERRQKSATEHLNAHNNSADDGVKIKELQQAAEAIFGDDFRIIPEFVLASQQGSEWKNAFTDGQSGKLLRFLTNPENEQDPQIDFPIDEWLYGVARVRQPMRLWEQVVMYTEALGRPEPNLIPTQFPFRTEDYWLGLNFPEQHVMDGDRLLYTAHYPVSFDPTQPQCGLILDEWAEVISTADPKTGDSLHETGISFHYDRPNTEPPQSWLLVIPSNWNGKWEWREIVGAIHQTLNLAKKRAVEPHHIDATPFAHFLPAVLLAATRTGISLSTFIAANNPKFNI